VGAPASLLLLVELSGMTNAAFEQARRFALDRNEADEVRCDATRRLADFRRRDAVVALLELGSRPDEPNSVLRAAGASLARLLDHGLVSEWDVRDLMDPAADAFHE
jgi:hypothetical protein